jgi:hypothetical protein
VSPTLVDRFDIDKAGLCSEHSLGHKQALLIFWDRETIKGIN